MRLSLLATLLCATALTACTSNNPVLPETGDTAPPAPGVVSLFLDNVASVDRAVQFSVVGPAEGVTLAPRVEGLVVATDAGTWDVIILGDAALSGRPLLELAVPDRNALAAYRVTIREVANGETFDVHSGAGITARLVP